MLRWIGLGLIVIGCGTGRIQEQESVPDISFDLTTNLPESREGLAQVLSRTSLLALNAVEFSSTQRISALEATLNRISELVIRLKPQQLEHKGPLTFRNPAEQELFQNLDDVTAQIHLDFKIERFESARWKLLQSTFNCYSCHLRSETNAAVNLNAHSASLSQLKPIARVEYLLSTGEWVTAETQLESILNSPEEMVNFFEIDRAARYLLLLKIYLQPSLEGAEIALQRMSLRSKLPFFLRHNIAAWETSLREWKQERPAPIQLDSISALIERGRRAQVGFADRGGDVHFLRALQQLGSWYSVDSERKREDEERARGLLLAGVAHAELKGLSITHLAEVFFESCIRRFPKTEVAVQCLHALRESWSSEAEAALAVPMEDRLNALASLIDPSLVQPKP